ncbi:MAG: hypothetical protein U5J95_10275 [Balneolaceae bacterium]|nr:hypothetical protein [Balneolaceae bacterium]
MKARTFYKTKIALAFVLSFVLTLLAVSESKANDITTNNDPYRVEEFTLDGPGNLEVRTSGGHITVKGSNSDIVRVEMYVRKNGRTLDRSDTDLDDFEIDISKSGNKVTATARTDRDRSWKFWNNNNISISFVVYTPREMNTDLKTSGGHVEASGLRGNQEVATSGGHLELTELRGNVQARTSGGHIDIAGFQGEIEARTSGGHIDVVDSEGNVRVRTSGGHIDMKNVAGTVEARTSGGSISADITSVGQFVDLRTSGGNVTVSVPGGIGLDLDLSGSRVRSELKNFSGEVERDEIRGSINGGGPKIAARTSGGTVRINFR